MLQPCMKYVCVYIYIYIHKHYINYQSVLQRYTCSVGFGDQSLR